MRPRRRPQPLIAIERQPVIQFLDIAAEIAILRQRRIGIIRLQVMPPRHRLFDSQGLGRRLRTPFFVGSVAESAKGASAGATVQGAGDFEDSAEEGLEDGEGGDGDADEGADAGEGGLGACFLGYGGRGRTYEAHIAGWVMPPGCSVRVGCCGVVGRWYLHVESVSKTPCRVTASTMTQAAVL